jgi:N-acetyl-anhydromuramyl-L-alanine amidase AmpD
MKLDISKIKQARLKESQFFAELSLKTQIYLHHTAGGGNAEAVSRYWNGNTERIATAFIIGADGLIVQCFSSKHWAWHLGVGQKEFKAQGVPYTNLNKTSVGIEVCNWGYLKEKNGHFYNYVNARVPDSMVTTLETPYKGYKHWYKYTDAQIESTRQLLFTYVRHTTYQKNTAQKYLDLTRKPLKTRKEFTPIIQYVKTSRISTLVQE